VRFFHVTSTGPVHLLARPVHRYLDYRHLCNVVTARNIHLQYKLVFGMDLLFFALVGGYLYLYFTNGEFTSRRWLITGELGVRLANVNRISIYFCYGQDRHAHLFATQRPHHTVLSEGEHC